jgi:hypothetical protein
LGPTRARNCDQSRIKGLHIKVLPVLYRDCDIPIFLQGKLYADYGITLPDVVDIVGRVARTALLHAMLSKTTTGETLRLSLIEPRTFVQRHVAGKVHMSMPNPTGRDAALTDLPNIQMNLIVRDAPPVDAERRRD